MRGRLVGGRPGADAVGVGVAEERERVFDPFYRVLGSGEIGSGLGLAITSSIANQIGAGITLMERPDGACGLRARMRISRAAAAGLAD